MYEHRQANPVRRVVRVTAAWAPVSWFYARTLHHIDRLVYRMTSGRATFVSWVAGLPIVMLTTTGARSGRRHRLPLVALPEGTREVVARELEGAERERFYERGIEIYPGWTTYRKRAAHRRIPVLELTPAE